MTSHADVAHLARRAGFGLAADDVDALGAEGYEAAVEVVVEGLKHPDPPAESVVPPVFDTARILADLQSADEAVRDAAQKALSTQQRELVRWWLNRMVVATEPWHEKLTFLWHDHFSTSLEKVRYPELMWMQHSTLHDLGHGRFDELVHALSRDGAMLIWLDGHQNRAGAPNENFARELLELFTLGHTPPGGHDSHAMAPYGEADVAGAARALTGWQVDRTTGQGVFRPQRHDPGVKTVLGVTGRLGLDDVVAAATGHEACAAHVVSRLWSRVGRPATPDDPVVVELAAPFRRDLDISAMLRRMFLHPAFLEPETRQALVKTPVEWVVGALRALRHHLPERTERLLVALGQVPFAPPDVSGWPANRAWLSTASAQMRLAAAVVLTAEADLASLDVAPSERLAAVGRLLGVDAWSPGTERALDRHRDDPRRLLTLALISPENLVA